MPRPSLVSLLARAWFPAGLLVLLVLAVPGFALFTLNLAGLGNDANAWLEQNFSVSHQMLIPHWGAVFLFLVPPLLVLLYFLKLKRKPLQVASTFLWKKSVEDLRVNSLFQWLRNNALLLLQLLAALALIYAVLGPRLHGQAAQGRRTIVLLDNSASMSATDVGPSRLEWAKGEANKLIDGLGDNDAGMLVVFNSSAETRQTFTTDKAVLRQAVSGVEPTTRPTSVEEALRLAESLANPARSSDDMAVRPANVDPAQQRTYVPPEGVPTDVHLISDGRFADLPEFALGNLGLHYHPAGKAGDSADNVGLAAFSAERDEDDPTKLNVFARVVNFRDKPASVKVRLTVSVGGRTQRVYEQTASAEARRPAGNAGQPGTPGESAAAFEVGEFDDTRDTVLHARIADARDTFAADDEAWQVVGVPRKARVLWVGPDNRVLSAFFDQEVTRAQTELTRLRAEDVTGPDRQAKYLKPARDDAAYDLAVFDRCAPATEGELPACNTLFVGHAPPPWEHAQLAIEPRPVVKAWNRDTGPLRGLSGLQDVYLERAVRLTRLSEPVTRYMEGERELGLLVGRPRGPHTDLVLAFDFYQTDWCLNRPSFPQFLRNVLISGGGLTETATGDLTRPGQVKLLRPGVGVREVRVTAPDGSESTLLRGTRAEFAFADAARPGVYRAAWGNEEHPFAVNLLDADESNLAPRESVRVGEAATRGDAGERRQPRDLWKWAVLLALGVLVVEWYVYNKRVAV